MSFPAINPEQHYASDAPELNILGSKQTRARLRHEGKGCKYLKIGGRVVYRGADILAFLDQCEVQTAA